MKITAQLIPHSLFHTGIWLQSVEDPAWYYFSERENDNIILNEEFYKSLDPNLKDIVTFLHEHNIRTTPSCAGHNKSREDFKKIYGSLVSDRNRIKDGGLRLKNVETGALYLYRDDDYELPWTKEEFLQRVMTYQKKGVLGIHSNDLKGLKKALMQLHIEGVTVKEFGDVVLLLTDGEMSMEQINNTWREITNQVKNIIVRVKL